MTSDLPEPRRRLRQGVYLLLIALSVGDMVGRTLAVNSVDNVRLEQYRIKAELDKRKARIRAELAAMGLSGDALAAAYQKALAERADEFARVERKLKLQRPFLSSNDRSRWCTIRALVERGTFAIEDIQDEPGWDTIDMVKHRGRDGEDHLYSSKPPLQGVLLAVPYWVIYHVTGYSLGEHPYEIGRAMVILINVLPMIVYFVLLAKLLERHGQRDFARVLVMATATGGTFLSTFAVVLNNHTLAAVCAMIVLYAVVRIWLDDRQETKYFVLAGIFAALAWVWELPALSFLAAVAVGLLWKFPRPALRAFLPAVAVVVVAAFVTNYVAHDTWKWPYAHRSKTDPSQNWYEFEFVRDGQVRQSYWTTPAGIDVGEESAAEYAFHVLIGHHGIFSLTPIWLLSVWGLLIYLRGRANISPDPRLRSAELAASLTPDPYAGRWRLLALLIVAVSLVCLAFYLSRGQLDRNYGGMTSGFRWVFWLAPLWLVGIIPAAARLGESRAGQIVAATLLGLSVLSASYPTWNPWTLPWLTNFFTHMEWSQLPG
jgi:hypothetical protein